MLEVRKRRQNLGETLSFPPLLWQTSNSVATDALVIMKVAKAVRIVLSSGQPYISIKLDMDLIEVLHMGITAESVCHSILNHPKIKLKEEVKYSPFYIYIYIY